MGLQLPLGGGTLAQFGATNIWHAALQAPPLLC